MKKLLTSGVFAILLGLIGLAPKAFAECQPIYGGGETCTNAALAVQKTVLNPATNTFVHDMGILDPRFHPNDQVVFHITVTNIGNAVANHVAVFDVVPQFVASTNPPINNGGNTTIRFDAGDMAPGASQTFTVTATLESAANFPANQAITCMNNQGQATDAQGDHAEDFSQFCVETLAAPTGLINVTPTPVPQVEVPTAVVQPVTQPTTLPSAGADPISYLALLPTGAIGVALRHFASHVRRKSKHT